MLFWKEIFWEQDHSEVKTMMEENRNFTEGLEDKVAEFSETGKPKKRGGGKREWKDSKTRGPVLQK